MSVTDKKSGVKPHTVYVKSAIYLKCISCLVLLQLNSSYAATPSKEAPLNNPQEKPLQLLRSEDIDHALQTQNGKDHALVIQPVAPSDLQLNQIESDNTVKSNALKKLWPWSKSTSKAKFPTNDAFENLKRTAANVQTKPVEPESDVTVQKIPVLATTTKITHPQNTAQSLTAQKPTTTQKLTPLQKLRSKVSTASRPDPLANIEKPTLSTVIYTQPNGAARQPIAQKQPKSMWNTLFPSNPNKVVSTSDQTVTSAVASASGQPRQTSHHTSLVAVATSTSASSPKLAFAQSASPSTAAATAPTSRAASISTATPVKTPSKGLWQRVLSKDVSQPKPVDQTKTVKVLSAQNQAKVVSPVSEQVFSLASSQNVAKPTLWKRWFRSSDSVALPLDDVAEIQTAQAAETQATEKVAGAFAQKQLAQSGFTAANVVQPTQNVSAAPQTTMAAAPTPSKTAWQRLFSVVDNVTSPLKPVVLTAPQLTLRPEDVVSDTHQTTGEQHTHATFLGKWFGKLQPQHGSVASPDKMPVAAAEQSATSTDTALLSPATSSARLSSSATFVPVVTASLTAPKTVTSTQAQATKIEVTQPQIVAAKAANKGINQANSSLATSVSATTTVASQAVARGTTTTPSTSDTVDYMVLQANNNNQTWSLAEKPAAKVAAPLQQDEVYKSWMIEPRPSFGERVWDQTQNISSLLAPQSDDRFRYLDLQKLSNFNFDQSLDQNSTAAAPRVDYAGSSRANLNAQPNNFANSNQAILMQSRLALSDAVRMAVLRHPQITQSISRLAAQNANIDVAKSQYYPQLSTGIATSDLTSSERGAQQLTLNLQQALFDFGKIKTNVNTEQAKLQVEQANVLLNIDDIAFKVASAVVNIKRYQAVSDIAKQQVEGTQRILDIAKLRAQAGISSQADPVQAQTYLESAQSNLIAQQSLLRENQQRLRTLLGADVSRKDLDIPDDLVQLSDLYKEPEFNKIPSMIVAQSQVEVAKSQRKETELSRYPTLLVRGSVSQSLNGRNPNNNQDNSTSSAILLEASSNFYQGGLNASQVKAASFAEQAAKAEVNSVYLDVLENIRTYREQIENKQEQIKVLVDRQQSTTRTRELYQEQYKLGTRTVLDLLNAEQAIHASNTELQNARYDIYINLVQYIATTGLSRDAYDLNSLTIQGVEIQP